MGLRTVWLASLQVACLVLVGLLVLRLFLRFAVNSVVVILFK